MLDWITAHPIPVFLFVAAFLLAWLPGRGRGWCAGVSTACIIISVTMLLLTGQSYEIALIPLMLTSAGLMYRSKENRA